MNRLYSIWSSMKQRCNNPKSSSAKYYCLKGIRVCDEWLDFKNFEKWALSNGYSDVLTIDRIDNSKNYEPCNCRWVTKSENSKKATQEKQGIWKVFPYLSTDTYDLGMFRYRAGYVDAIAENLSYSEALRIARELEKDEKTRYGHKRYRVINKYGDFRKIK